MSITVGTIRRFLLLLMISKGSFVSAAVWESQSTWSESWEQTYHQWVQENWEKNIFLREGAWWRGVTVDCADNVYGMRLIFAAEHELPFAMRDPSGSGVITNNMKRFDGLEPSARKRAFFQYIQEVGSTHSLPEDTYPVAVNRDAIGSGRMIITDARSHHSWAIKYLEVVRRLRE